MTYNGLALGDGIANITNAAGEFLGARQNTGYQSYTNGPSGQISSSIGGPQGGNSVARYSSSAWGGAETSFNIALEQKCVLAAFTGGDNSLNGLPYYRMYVTGAYRSRSVWKFTCGQFPYRLSCTWGRRGVSPNGVIVYGRPREGCE